jgi:GMP synthase (glutamine-hydrolysing)
MLSVVHFFWQSQIPATKRCVKVIRANAQKKFYDALSNENNPEAKRKIIGHAFIEVFEEEARKLDDIK